MEIKMKEVVKAEVVKRCIICEQASDSGVTILKCTICNKCENKILNITVEDKRYDYYKDLIKMNLVNNFKFYKI